MDKKEILSRIAAKIEKKDDNRLTIYYEGEWHNLEIDKDTNTIWITYGLNQFPGFRRIGDKIIELEKVSDEEFLYIYQEVIPY